MNYNETTGEKVKRSIYDDIRNEFKERAVNWNGVWKVWLNKSPDPNWEGRWVPGWKGGKIQMHDTIPYEKRLTKRGDYNPNDENEVNPQISQESSLIHTVGNENLIRSGVKNLNDKLTKYFVDEYKNNEKIENRKLVSYGVKYNEIDTNGDIVSSVYYWTPSYKTEKGSDVINLYSDPLLKTFYKRVQAMSINGNKKYSVVWTEDRYYDTIQESVINQPKLIGEVTSKDLTKMGVKKYSELKPNPNDVYNGQQLLDNPDKTSTVEYEKIEETNNSNQKAVYTFNGSENWKLNNENIIRKADYQQIKTLLGKINKCLKLRDKWFDSNNRCQVNCQVNCQNTCQTSCQACNTKQCHDQKCGTH